MTAQAFYDVPVGVSTKELKEIAGKPAAIHKKDNITEYEYVERFNNGARTTLERHYYFVIKEDKVVSRRVEQVSPPPYSINSYDLQTSFSKEKEENLSN